MRKLPFPDRFSPLPTEPGPDEADRSAEGAPDDFTRYVITLTKRPGQRLSEPLIRAHVAHLRQLDAAGRLILCGPFADGQGGMIIVRAGSLAEAEAIAQADPFVTSGTEDYTVRTWHLSCEANNHMGMG